MLIWCCIGLILHSDNFQPEVLFGNYDLARELIPEISHNEIVFVLWILSLLEILIWPIGLVAAIYRAITDENNS